MLRFGPAILHNFDRAQRLEWLLPNGLGGYTSSTVIGANSRGYHGLLVAAVPPPRSRYLLLAKIEEELELGGEKYNLSCNRYPGVIHPQGHLLLHEFRMAPWPTFQYKLGQARLEKQVCVVSGENRVIVRYRLRGVDCAHLRLRPLLNARDYHSRTSASGLRFEQQPRSDGTTVRSSPTKLSILLVGSGLRYRASADWYYNFVYDLERERGLPDREDHYTPGEFEGELVDGGSVTMEAADRVYPPTPAEMTLARTGRRTNATTWLHQLSERSLGFIVSHGEGERSLIAGYHWFTDWSRDALISLPGLLLTGKRFSEARSILHTLAKYARDGLLPAYFPERGGDLSYAALDAPLWFVSAVERYVNASGDVRLGAEILAPMTEMMRHLRRGTRYGICEDDDGLLRGGDGASALTWMDAVVDGQPVTPRHGKPVEINSLWYHAELCLVRLAKQLGAADVAAEFREAAQRTRASFNRIFWNAADRCLFDAVSDRGSDAAIRPNQLFAISLPDPVLDQRYWPGVLAAVEKHLRTPYGLRTLTPLHPAYRGRYEGGVRERDLAYHQGTVWPWLLGAYVDALARVNPGKGVVRRRVLALMAPLAAHLHEAGIGWISELFDGDEPHRPKGCIAQAWNAAEILRIAATHLAISFA